MHADRAVGAVVADDGHDIESVLDGRSQLLARHHETAVAGECHDGPCRMGELGGNGGRQPVTHRPGRRRKLGAVALVLEIAVYECRVVPGTAGDDAVLRKHLGNCADHLFELHGARCGDWLQR